MSTYHRAQQMSAAFERRTRDTGESFDVLADGSPEWMTDVAMHAHGDMWPDDWRYRMIAAAVEWLAEAGELDPDEEADNAATFADQFVPVYNSDRFAWLASHLHRAGYVDDAVEDLGHSDTGVTGDIGMGIYQEAAEVYAMVVEALADIDAGEGVE